ncbi:chemotaxis response regulator protein-glutamate methylesterase [Candidatus Pacearchaeota archaeon]|nr:MAG: chemotaxis response regulator protein-glutamate methylesterase [Candidatus Pacearchaeota archaeon]
MIKVLIVDDSILIRKMIKDMLSDVGDIEIIGEARDGLDALDKIKTFKPDVVLLDYEMPGLNGIEVLKRIMKENPIPVIMFSAYSREGSYVALKSLELGAFDYMLKPNYIGEKVKWFDVKKNLIKKIKNASKVSVDVLLRKYLVKERKEFVKIQGIKVIGIGASTGGPKVIKYILSSLPLMDLTIFVVQHLPPGFENYFKSYLESDVSWKVKVAQDGEEIKKGFVYIPKSGLHIKVSGGKILYEEGEPVNGVMPSVDVLFESLVDEYSGEVLGVVLTGMGRDGGMGALKIKEYGGEVIIQSPDTCVVPSMPLYVKKLLKNVKILPPEKIPEEIVRICQNKSN